MAQLDDVTDAVVRMRGQFVGGGVPPTGWGPAPLRGALGLWVWSVGIASLNPRLLTGIALRCVVGLGQLHVIGALKGLCRLPAGESEGELVD